MTQEIMKKPRPELRFKGFTDDWAQRQFAQLANCISETGNSSTLPWVEYGDIDNTTNALNKDITKRAGVKSGIVFQPGDVLFGKLRPYLRNYLLANFRGVAVGDFWVLRPSNGESLFLYALIQTERYLFAANHCAGSKMPRSDWKFVSNAAFRIPSTIEQQRIGDFFRTLDNLIVAAERKVELLKRRKKAYLRRIFNQELRFKADDGSAFSEWEEKTLGDLGRLGNGYAFKSDSYVPHGKYRVITIANVQGERYVTELERANTVNQIPDNIASWQILKESDILISLTGNIGRVSLNTGCDNLLNQRVGLFEVFSPISDRQWVFQRLSANDFRNAMEGAGQGAAQKNISRGDVESFPLSVPSLPEQRKIAACLNAMDDLISAAEHRVELLQKRKQGYMQRMFV
ncbi:MAG: restriction endonuclease subunit S [Aeriscardovia sp.]|nr:restriction endonuclease subunit S [Aeriscardovia sp.]